MPRAVYPGSRKGSVYQTAITDEANTDASATWGAPESTLANSEKVKINAILPALRSAKVLAVGGAGKPISVASLKGQAVQTNVTDEATANSDATYDAAEQALLNSMKAKVNSIILAMRSARIIGGRQRFVSPTGRRARMVQTDIVVISIADADGTYTAGGAGEQGLANDIKLKINQILVALRNAKIIV